MPDCVRIESYGEARGIDTNYKEYIDYVVFGGLQYYLMKYLSGIVITEDDFIAAKELVDKACGKGVFEEEMWREIIDKYGGKLPIIIHALPEGTKVPIGTPLFKITTVEDNKKFKGITNFVETIIMNVWHPTTVLTVGHAIQQEVRNAWILSVDENLFHLNRYSVVDDSKLSLHNFVINDFSPRGNASVEESIIGGIMHFLLSAGSDNVVANAMMNIVYPTSRQMCYTVPATEHSVMTLRGKDGELDVFKHTISQYKDGIVSIVLDGYDILNAVENVVAHPDIIEDVKNRNGKIVIRLDSGDAIQTILRVLSILEDKFGVIINNKGFKTLPPFIGIMQADGVNLFTIREIYKAMLRNKWAASNIVFGSGGALIHNFTRDTLKFAIKCSIAWFTDHNGDIYSKDVFKSPKELNSEGIQIDSFKISKKGSQKTIKNGNTGTYKDYKASYVGENNIEDEMKPIFEVGVYLNVQGSDEIANRIEQQYNDITYSEENLIKYLS